MAKIQTARFGYTDENNNHLEYKADVNVGAEGVFSLRIPEFLARFINNELKGKSDSKVHLYERANGTYAQSKVLDTLLKFIQTCFSVYSAPEVTKELVLLYKLHGVATVWQNLDGTLRANGAGAVDGQWVDYGGNFNSVNPPPGFGVSVAARVCVLVTKTRGLSVTTEYDHVRSMFPDMPDADVPGAKLNAFNCSVGKNAVQMPYTAEAETFFANLMMATAELARRVSEFGADPARIQHAIAHGSNLISSVNVAIEHKPDQQD